MKRKIISLFVKIGISPNSLTLIGLGLGVFSCLSFILTKNWLLFIILLSLSVCFDFLDGGVARASNKVTKFGSYLDAISDRVLDGLILITTAYITGYWMLCSLLMLLTLSVSYAKARAALEVPILNTEWPDLMQRPQRIIFIIIGLSANQIIPFLIGGQDILFWTLFSMNGLVGFTLLQRIYRAYIIIKERS
jgi:phosphatidylglycerophosphate synthase